ncbi:MAG: response regulator [Candidatus Aminicenantaceae bacterium]
MKKILIVDDDKLIRWSLKEIFAQEGYEVDTVATIQDALKRVINNKYNLVFADIEISKENGIKMIKKIHEIQPPARIIILSAYPKEHIESLLSGKNIFSIIEKPFQAEKIKDIARDALNI